MHNRGVTYICVVNSMYDYVEKQWVMCNLKAFYLLTYLWIHKSSLLILSKKSLSVQLGKKKKVILKQNENISLLLPGSPFTPGGPGIPSRPWLPLSPASPFSPGYPTAPVNYKGPRYNFHFFYFTQREKIWIPFLKILLVQVQLLQW